MKSNDIKHPLRFGKAHKLRHRSLVEGLFRHGRNMYEFPLRMVYRVMTRQEMVDNFSNYPPAGIAPVQMMVTVPKKKLRHAVDRVMMRRRIREAFRLNAPVHREIDGKFLQIAFVYLHSDILPYDTIEQKMIRLMQKLTAKIEPDEIKTDCNE